MSTGETVLAKKVLIVGDKEKGARATVDLRVRGVASKTTLLLSLADLPNTSQALEEQSDLNLDVVV